MAQVEKNFDISLENKEVLADASFCTIKNVNCCDEQGVNAYIADSGMRGRNPLYKNQSDKKPESRK